MDSRGGEECKCVVQYLGRLYILCEMVVGWALGGLLSGSWPHGIYKKMRFNLNRHLKFSENSRSRYDKLYNRRIQVRSIYGYLLFKVNNTQFILYAKQFCLSCLHVHSIYFKQ